MITLTADKLTVQGPQVDGGYKIIFYVGEYEQQNVAALMKLEQGGIITLQVTNEKEDIWEKTPTE